MIATVTIPSTIDVPVPSSLTIAAENVVPRHRRRFFSLTSPSIISSSPSSSSSGTPVLQVISGNTHLCFSEDGAWFEGHLIATADESQYGLVGNRLPFQQKQNSSASASTTDSATKVVAAYDVTIIDHEDAETYTVPSVTLTCCAPLCVLSSSSFRFTAQEAFRGQKADMLIQRYLTPRLVGKNLKVYAGQLTVNLQEVHAYSSSPETRMWYL